ncbi:MAG TPA: lipid II flippase MurJ, partial [Candidatus Acidoferrum sp.]|nr:lipid II flippase MurJ [Candidatus Acidoferrum sp.]
MTRRLKTIAGVTGVVLVSKLFGLSREMVIADRFGTTADYDLYLIAVMLPALAWGVISFAVYYLFVPYLTRNLEATQSASPREHWRSTWSLFNLTFVSAFVIMLAIIASAPLVMRIWARGYAEADFARVLFYCRATAVMVLLGAVEAYFRSVLNARKIFAYPATGMILFNIGVIAGTLLFESTYGVGAVAIGFIGGFVLQDLFLLVRLIPMGAIGAFSISWPDEELRPIATTATALIIIEMLNRSYFLIDRFFAPAFGEGIISALNYGQVLVQLPDAVVGFSIASVVFPLLSESAREESAARFGSLYREAIIGGLLIAVPMAVYFFVNASDLVYLMFYRGEFNANSVAITARVLRPYTPTIVALFIVSTSIRACYARNWARQVLWFTVALLALKLVGTFALSRWGGYPGISAASSISQVIFAALLMNLVTRRSGMADRAGFLDRVARIILAGVLSLALIWLFNLLISKYMVDNTRVFAAVRLAISAIALATLFAVVSSMLGFKDYLMKLLGRGV